MASTVTTSHRILSLVLVLVLVIEKSILDGAMSLAASAHGRR